MSNRDLGFDSNLIADVCQETWFRAWRHRESFQSGTSFKAWLFSIASNFLKDEWRKKKPLPLTDASSLADKRDASEPEGTLDQKRMAILQDCMKTLSPEEAGAVKMKTEGWSSEEIAEKLGMSNKNQVYQLRCRAMKKLISCVERRRP